MINYTLLLAAIAFAESDYNDLAVGGAGERSRYQITSDVWYEHSEENFIRASRDPQIASNVAIAHIRHCIEPALQKAGREVTVRAIAGCWNAGITGYLRTKPTPARVHSYIKKVNDKYTRLSRKPAVSP